MEQTESKYSSTLQSTGKILELYKEILSESSTNEGHGRNIQAFLEALVAVYHGNEPALLSFSFGNTKKLSGILANIYVSRSSQSFKEGGKFFWSPDRNLVKALTILAQLETNASSLYGVFTATILCLYRLFGELVFWKGGEENEEAAENFVGAFDTFIALLNSIPSTDILVDEIKRFNVLIRLIALISSAEDGDNENGKRLSRRLSIAQLAKLENAKFKLISIFQTICVRNAGSELFVDHLFQRSIVMQLLSLITSAESYKLGLSLRLIELTISVVEKSWNGGLLQLAAEFQQNEGIIALIDVFKDKYNAFKTDKSYTKELAESFFSRFCDSLFAISFIPEIEGHDVDTDIFADNKDLKKKNVNLQVFECVLSLTDLVSSDNEKKSLINLIDRIINYTDRIAHTYRIVNKSFPFSRIFRLFRSSSEENQIYMLELFFLVTNHWLFTSTELHAYVGLLRSTQKPSSSLLVSRHMIQVLRESKVDSVRISEAGLISAVLDRLESALDEIKELEAQDKVPSRGVVDFANSLFELLYYAVFRNNYSQCLFMESNGMELTTSALYIPFVRIWALRMLISLSSSEAEGNVIKCLMSVLQSNGGSVSSDSDVIRMRTDILNAFSTIFTITEESKNKFREAGSIGFVYTLLCDIHKIPGVWDGEGRSIEESADDGGSSDEGEEETGSHKNTEAKAKENQIDRKDVHDLLFSLIEVLASSLHDNAKNREYFCKEFDEKILSESLGKLHVVEDPVISIPFCNLLFLSSSSLSQLFLRDKGSSVRSTNIRTLPSTLQPECLLIKGRRADAYKIDFEQITLTSSSINVELPIFISLLVEVLGAAEQDAMFNTDSEFWRAFEHSLTLIRLLLTKNFENRRELTSTNILKKLLDSFVSLLTSAGRFSIKKTMLDIIIGLGSYCFSPSDLNAFFKLMRNQEECKTINDLKIKSSAVPLVRVLTEIANREAVNPSPHSFAELPMEAKVEFPTVHDILWPPIGIQGFTLSLQLSVVDPVGITPVIAFVGQNTSIRFFINQHCKVFFSIAEKLYSFQDSVDKGGWDYISIVFTTKEKKKRLGTVSLYINGSLREDLIVVYPPAQSQPLKIVLGAGEAFAGGDQMKQSESSKLSLLSEDNRFRIGCVYAFYEALKESDIKLLSKLPFPYCGEFQVWRSTPRQQGYHVSGDLVWYDSNYAEDLGKLKSKLFFSFIGSTSKVGFHLKNILVNPSEENPVSTYNTATEKVEIVHRPRLLFSLLSQGGMKALLFMASITEPALEVRQEMLRLIVAFLSINIYAVEMERIDGHKILGALFARDHWLNSTSIIEEIFSLAVVTKANSSFRPLRSMKHNRIWNISAFSEIIVNFLVWRRAPVNVQIRYITRLREVCKQRSNWTIVKEARVFERLVLFCRLYRSVIPEDISNTIFSLLELLIEIRDVIEEDIDALVGLIVPFRMGEATIPRWSDDLFRIKLPPPGSPSLQKNGQSPLKHETETAMKEQDDESNENLSDVALDENWVGSIGSANDHLSDEEFDLDVTKEVKLSVSGSSVDGGDISVEEPPLPIRSKESDPPTKRAALSKICELTQRQHSAFLVLTRVCPMKVLFALLNTEDDETRIDILKILGKLIEDPKQKESFYKIRGFRLMALIQEQFEPTVGILEQYLRMMFVSSIHQEIKCREMLIPLLVFAQRCPFSEYMRIMNIISSSFNRRGKDKSSAVGQDANLMALLDSSLIFLLCAHLADTIYKEEQEGGGRMRRKRALIVGMLNDVVTRSCEIGRVVDVLVTVLEYVGRIPCSQRQRIVAIQEGVVTSALVAMLTRPKSDYVGDLSEAIADFMLNRVEERRLYEVALKVLSQVASERMTHGLDVQQLLRTVFRILEHLLWTGASDLINYSLSTLLKERNLDLCSALTSKKEYSIRLLNSTSDLLNHSNSSVNQRSRKLWTIMVKAHFKKEIEGRFGQSTEDDVSPETSEEPESAQEEQGAEEKYLISEEIKSFLDSQYVVEDTKKYLTKEIEKVSSRQANREREFKHRMQLEMDHLRMAESSWNDVSLALMKQYTRQKAHFQEVHDLKEQLCKTEISWEKLVKKIVLKRSVWCLCSSNFLKLDKYEGPNRMRMKLKLGRRLEIPSLLVEKDSALQGKKRSASEVASDPLTMMARYLEDTGELRNEVAQDSDSGSDEGVIEVKHPTRKVIELDLGESEEEDEHEIAETEDGTGVGAERVLADVQEDLLGDLSDTYVDFGRKQMQALMSSKKILLSLYCSQIKPFYELPGEIVLCNDSAWFIEQLETTNKPFLNAVEEKKTIRQNFAHWAFKDVVGLYKRRYLFMDNSLEIFLSTGKSLMFTFKDVNDRDDVLAQLNNSELPMLASKEDNLKNLLSRWQKGQLTNFEYVFNLNSFAGRTFNDLSQYPIFPHTISDFSSKELDLFSEYSFRDLSKPMGAQTTERLMKFINQHNSLQEAGEEPYYYGSHYSNIGTVLFFLLRLSPYSEYFKEFQGGKFDLPDRLFHSVESTWRLSSCLSKSDVKELIPEFFYLPEFLQNVNHHNFGVKANNEVVDDVFLPPWANGSARYYVRKHLEAFESEFVSQNLHQWIDLIFGYKQKGQEALWAHNLFHPKTYEGTVDLSAIEDPDELESNKVQINGFGQIPKQLFTRPHQSRQSNAYSPVIKSAFHAEMKFEDIVSQIESAENAPGARDIDYYEDNIILSEKSRVTLPPTFVPYVDIVWNGSLCLYNQKGSVTATMEREDWGELLCGCSIENGRHVIYGCQNSTIYVFAVRKLNSLISVAVLHGHLSEVVCVASCSPFAFFVTGSNDGTIIYWDSRKWKFWRSVPVEGKPKVIAVSATIGDVFVYTEDSKGFNIFLFSINGVICASRSYAGKITCARFTTNAEGVVSNIIATGNTKGEIVFWNSLNLEPLATLNPATNGITGICFKPDNSRMFAIDGNGMVLGFRMKNYRKQTSIALQQSASFSTITS